jgi:hypothetical protein
VHRIITGIVGRIYWADAHPDYRTLRPLFCFVPEIFFTGEKFDEKAYGESAWPRVNCGSNPNGIGSHLYPDLRSPVLEKESSPELEDFLDNLGRHFV